MHEVGRDDLASIVGHISDIAVKHWLKVSGLPHSAANEDQFYSLLLKLINKKGLTVERLRLAAVEIEENSNKHIYLRQIEVPACLYTQSNFEQHIKQFGIHLSSPDTSVKHPRNPILNYVSWSDKEIRVKYSETHTKVVPNYETRSWSTSNITNYAIAVVELGTGFTQIRLDPPATVHPHKDPITNRCHPSYYVDYYFEEFSRILGNSKFEMYDLIKATDYLVKAENIFRLPLFSGLGSDNLHCRLSRKDDIRKSEAYKALARADKDMSSEKLTGYWLSDQSGSDISREVYMSLDRKSAKVSFFRDCLASEVNYALERIRQAAG